jgi:flagellar hook-associated protein 2
VAGIAFTGLASGLNSTQIIEALLTTDNGRIAALQAQKTTIATRMSAIGTLKSKLSAVISKAEGLRFQNQVMTRGTTTSNATGVSATATSQAAIGSFTVTVDQLATSTRRDGATGVGTESFTATGAGSLATSGLLLTPTAGRFTINGTSIDVVAPDEVDDFIAAINAAEASTGVRADYVLDGGGNPTRVRIYNTTTPGAPIQLGSAGDTSNFLNATKLSTATQVGDDVISTNTLGRANVSATLANARLATAVAPATGTFTVNGVSFNWDSAVDSINSLASRINSSAANVSASYDAVTNRLSLTSKNTGAQSIAVADTTGNLMAALGATTAAGATEALGQNALYRVDTIAGGAQQSSTTNAVTGAVQGVTFTLLKQGESSTIAVNQDTEKPLAAMKEFITAFNDAAEHIRQLTKRDGDGVQGGPLKSESAIRLIGTQLRVIATSGVSGLAGPYASLMDIGVTSGAIGSTAGTTNNLVLDEEKFKEKLAADPQAVYELLSSATAGSEGVLHNLRTYLNGAVLPSGQLSAMSSSSTKMQSDLDLRIAQNTRRLEQKRSRLELQFARMEGAVAQLQAQGNRLNSQLNKLG